MRVKALLAGMLLASILSIPGTMIQPFSLLGPARAERVPSEVLRPVRTCLATIDQFIADGDLTSLWQGLDQLGHGLDPWPSVHLPQRDLAALAFRATYPHLHLTLDEITPSDELYLAQIGVADSSANLPAWMTSQRAPGATTVNALLMLDEHGTIVGPAPPFPTSTLVYTPPGSGAPFALSGPSQLVAALLTLTPADHGDRSIAIAGPAMIAPETGTLRVEGQGRIFAPGESLTRWRQLHVGETVTISPGDLLEVSSGTAVLSTSSSNEVNVIYASVLPIHLPDDSETEGGHVTHRTLAGTIMAANAPSPVWFGSIDWVRQTTGEMAAGNASLSASWIVMTAGERATIAPDGGVSFVVDLPTGAEPAARPANQQILSNPTSETQIKLVFRIASY
jgi:hypothetical protein